MYLNPFCIVTGKRLLKVINFSIEVYGPVSIMVRAQHLWSALQRSMKKKDFFISMNWLNISSALRCRQEQVKLVPYSVILSNWIFTVSAEFALFWGISCSQQPHNQQEPIVTWASDSQEVKADCHLQLHNTIQ